MRAPHAKQIRAGVEAALRGERRTDGAGTSLECRAFNRTVMRMREKRSQDSKARARAIVDLEYEFHYPHPDQNSICNHETLIHIVNCLYCRYGHFKWIMERSA